MATKTKLMAASAFYGYTDFTNSASVHMYIGADKSESKYNYRSRVTMKPMSSISEIGDSRIAIRDMKLHLRRNDGGPSTITIGCSSSGAWNADLDASTTARIDKVTGWYIIDLTPLANAVAEYKATWYLHFRDGTPRLRCSGTGSGYTPYIEVTWEYVAATISGDIDDVVLGQPVIYTIKPEVAGETHKLEYSIGSQSGLIAENGGNEIVWAPPLSLASQIPDDDTDVVRITMSAFDADGVQIRTEAYYQTVSLPATMIPVIESSGLSIEDGLEGIALSGKSKLLLAPVIDMNETYGADIVSVIASISGGQAIKWTSLDEIDPAKYAGNVARSSTLSEVGRIQVILTVTDTRGRIATLEEYIDVVSYTAPTIAAFSVERYEAIYSSDEEITGYVSSDIGGMVWVNLIASAAPVLVNGENRNTISWKIEARSVNKIHTATGSGGLRIEMLQNRSVFDEAVSESETWQYTLTVTDSVGSSVTQYAVVSPGRVGLSITPDRYGVAVGMIATGNSVSPAFEVSSRYRSYLHGGVWGKNNHRVDAVGSRETISISSVKFDSYNAELTPTISRVGAIVFMDGFLTNTVELESGFSEAVATLPEWARPAIDVSVMQQGSGNNIWWLRINKDGTVLVCRYRNGSDNSVATVGRQFPLSACWLAADACLRSYSVDVNLSGCTISNVTKNITEGQEFIATLMPNHGYEMSSVIVMMDGKEMAGCYNADNGSIRISSVEGDILILATATALPTSLTFEVNTDGDATLMNVSITPDTYGDVTISNATLTVDAAGDGFLE